MRTAPRVLLSLLLSSSSLGACAGRTAEPAAPAPAPVAAPTCPDATAHMIAVLRTSDEMKQASDEARQKAESVMLGAAQDLLEDCEQKPWSAQRRRCAAEAQRVEDLEACDLPAAALLPAAEHPGAATRQGQTSE